MADVSANVARPQLAARDRSAPPHGSIRLCTPDDLPEVAGLFHKTFRNSRTQTPASLEACLHEVFFQHPWQDAGLPSRLYSCEGRVAGFIGVLPLRMSFRGRQVLAAVPSSIVVDNPARHPLAGARLLRSFINGPQELSISEPLNATTQAMWARLGGHSFASESMEWLRPLRPSELAASLLIGRAASVLPARSLARLADRLVGKFTGQAFEPTKRRLSASARDASDNELIELVPRFADCYALRPEFDPAALMFVIGHASRNRARGTLHRQVVFDKSGPIGCYIYQGRPGGVAWVLQILTTADAAPSVIDSLIEHAYAHGCVAIKGRTQLRLLEALLDRKCVFLRRHSAAVHSRNPELLEAVRSGDAVTSGFAAESWTKLIGEEFD